MVVKTVVKKLAIFTKKSSVGVPYVLVKEAQ